MRKVILMFKSRLPWAQRGILFCWKKGFCESNIIHAGINKRKCLPNYIITPICYFLYLPNTRAGIDALVDVLLLSFYFIGKYAACVSRKFAKESPQWSLPPIKFATKYIKKKKKLEKYPLWKCGFHGNVKSSVWLAPLHNHAMVYITFPLKPNTA